MTAAMYVLVGAALVWSFIKDKEKTRQALGEAVKYSRKMLLSVVLMVAFIGFLITFLPASLIARYIGPGTGFAGTVTAALVGAVTYIPSMIAFPLAGSLLDMGASVMTIAAFITTLTMVGFVTTPLEIKELGLRFTLWRNGLAFLSALFIASVMGVALS